MVRSRLLQGALIGLVVWLTAFNGFSEQRGLYVNTPFGFQLEVPERWVAQPYAAPEVQSFLATTRGALSSSTPQLASGLVVIFSEFPIGASVSFNPNITVSIHQLDAPARPPETLLSEAATHLTGGAPSSSGSPMRAPVNWMWRDYQYEQLVGQRHVPITARLAVTVDPRQQRYVLITASSLNTLFDRYEPVFRQCVQSFQWTPPSHQQQ